MEQKSYKLEFEIIDELLKGEAHIRRIAKRLNINHMSIARKIKGLEKDNVLDYEVEGKNKKYFIKKTIEAKSYIFSAENYKLNMVLKKYPSLRIIVEKIQKDKRVKLAILFGSYAKGLAKEGSDVDIYIDTSNSSIKKELRLIDSRLSIRLGRYNRKDLLIREIEKNHTIIKGVEAYYEKNKFFD